MAYLRKKDRRRGSELDIVEADTDKLQANLAILAIRQAADHNDIKYSLQDRIIDDYYDASGVDGTPSTNHLLTSGVYSGIGSIAPTVTENADVGPTVDGDYTYYKWTTVTGSGSYSTNSTQDHEILVVAGGASGGRWHASGGGAGGYRTSAALSLVASTTYTITVGAGGASATSGGYSGAVGTDGNNSSITGSDITNIESEGGGGGGHYGNPNGVAARPGGSGGGGGPMSGGTAGAAGAASPVTSPVQGYVGGLPVSGNIVGAGGGGAGAAGGIGTGTTPNGHGGAGGIGVQNDITGTNVWYAGGGGGNAGGGDGGAGGSSIGGVGAAGTGSAGAGTVNTGSGGGGVSNDTASSGAGGSGVVIIRRQTLVADPTTPDDLILQSTDTEAETQPTKADMVMLVEDAGSGVGTVQTHIKGWISRDSGTTFTQGTLVDEGDWGTDKRILAFHDLDISGQPADKTMCYKITTHSASAVYNTKVHAASIGWK